MATTRLAPWFRREDYDTFRRLIADEAELPATFDEWEKMQAEKMAKLPTAVEQIVIDPDEYVSWCRACGLDTNRVTLGAYAVAVTNRRR